MAQFKVYRLPDGDLVLDLQSDLIETGSRIAAPLLPPSESLRPFSRLEPVFQIDGSTVVMRSGEMAAVPARLLSGPAVADLTAQDCVIRGALDMLFSGF